MRVQSREVPRILHCLGTWRDGEAHQSLALLVYAGHRGRIESDAPRTIHRTRDSSRVDRPAFVVTQEALLASSTKTAGFIDTYNLQKVKA